MDSVSYAGNRTQIADCAHRWRLQIDGALGVENEVEQAAVGVVALELDLERCREVERLGSGS